MNEKIYIMPVEEANIEKEIKGVCLNDELLLLDSKKLVSRYKGKKLVPVTSINSVGIMTAPVRLGIGKINIPGYLVYTIDKNGKIQKFGVVHLKFNIALCVAREFYINKYVKKGPSHSDHIKVYSEMRKEYDDREQKYTRIRHLHK